MAFNEVKPQLLMEYHLFR